MAERKPNTGKETLAFNYNWDGTDWVPNRSSVSGVSEVEVISPANSVGELSVSLANAFVQSLPSYGLTPANFRSYSATGGSVAVESNYFKVSSGTSQGGYGSFQSFRSVTCKAGESVAARFGARFLTSGAGSWQGVGFLTVGDELSFGYDGASFGVWHRYHGKAEVRTLTISAGAGGAENATVTINTVAYTVPLTSGSAALAAKLIADYLTANASSVLEAWQNGSTVTVNFLTEGPKSGTYSFSSASAAASWAQTTLGVVKTSDFIAQADWNQNVFASLDPSKGNSYQIEYQAGYGNVTFSVQEADSGHYVKAHILQLSNVQTLTAVTNPSMRVGLYSVNTTGTANREVRCPSLAAFVQGEIRQTRNPRAAESTKTVSATTLTNLLTLRNRRIFNGNANQAEIEPQIITIASESSKIVYIKVYGGATLAGTPNYADAATNSIAEIDTAGTTVTGGTLLTVFALAPNSQVSFDLTRLKIRIPPTLLFTVAAYVTSGAASSIGCAVTWLEDF